MTNAPQFTRYAARLAAGLLLAVLINPGSNAATLERIIMPGDVIEGHAKYEDECSRCHRPFSKAAQNSLCLDCHEKVEGDLKAKRGYHGLDKEIKETKCSHCHTDHKGRGADVVGLNRELFDHIETDFPLKGGHAKVSCAKCHKPEEKWREAPLRCIKCHKKKDVHKERLGEKCEDCHKESSWKKARFDHSKTKFKLKGKHKEATCAACHPNQKFKKTPKECLSCHRLDDVHRGSYGKKCGDCHTPRDWKKTRFDHSKTDFPLKGRHDSTPCGKCHKEQYYDEKISKTCHGCHRNDDEHKGRYGKKCADCHNEKGWKKARFDHSKTDFPLKGKHDKVVCEKCHPGPIDKKKAERICNDCHAPGDPHRGQQGKKCERCHNEKGWRGKVFFDHDITRFPLIGLHAAAPCEACHLSAAYKDTKPDCESCHKADDKHKRKLGPECGDCHNPNGWRLWRFEHDTRTDFKLDGAHEGLTCVTCHTKPSRKKPGLAKNCAGCHYEDDLHQGRFGLNCKRCHTTKSFDELEIGP
jgi:hypothetical protein